MNMIIVDFDKFVWHVSPGYKYSEHKKWDGWANNPGLIHLIYGP